jgi:hypothetical protein
VILSHVPAFIEPLLSIDRMATFSVFNTLNNWPPSAISTVVTLAIVNLNALRNARCYL